MVRAEEIAKKPLEVASGAVTQLGLFVGERVWCCDVQLQLFGQRPLENV